MAQVQQQVFRSDPALVSRLKKLGAQNIELCFNCGNCTAICPVSSESSNFPRKLITYAQLGLEGKIVESPDMWLCNYCGECSKTCPREAEPAESMMAFRRLATSRYDPTAISRRLYESRRFTVIFMALIALVPLGLIAGLSGPADLQSVRMFSFIPEVWIHNVGVALGVFVFAVVALGLARMYRMVSKGTRNEQDQAGKKSGWLRELAPTVLSESLAQERLAKCESSPVTGRARLKTRWFTHMTIVWGFLGLLASTMLRYMAFPTNGQTVPITDPVRLLGTVSGAFLIYGASVFIMGRLRKADTASEHTHFTDWVFLILLLLAGLTGFMLEVLDYAGVPSLVYAALAIHLVVVFELLVMAPFSKFAHALYRPFALWIGRARNYI